MSDDKTEEQKRHEEVLREQAAQEARTFNEGIPGYSNHPEWRDKTPEEIADEIEAREGS